MQVNALQIRQALIAIAKEKGRPEFGLCVIRDVICAIQNNEPHELGRIVLARIQSELKDRTTLKDCEQTIRLKRLRAICTSESIKRSLGEESGLGLKYINHMVRGRYEINNSLWSRLEPLLKQYEVKVDLRND